jgi:hypothetical protein
MINELWEALNLKFTDDVPSSISTAMKGAFFAGAISAAETVLALPEAERTKALQQLRDEGIVATKAMS